MDGAGARPAAYWRQEASPWRGPCVISIYRDASSRVFLIEVAGPLTEDDLAQADRVRRAIVEREGPVRTIFDFSAVSEVVVPTSSFVERGRRPSIMGDQPRVYVVPHPETFGLARLYRSHQGASDNTPPALVKTRAEAFALLGLVAPDFQPVAFE